MKPRRKLSAIQLIEIKNQIRKQVNDIVILEERKESDILFEIYVNQIYQKLGKPFLTHFLIYELAKLRKELNTNELTLENVAIYSFRDFNELYVDC